MKGKLKQYGILFTFIVIELGFLLKFRTSDPYSFKVTDHCFFWGMIFLLFSFVLRWGFDNRSALSNMSPNADAPYNHNVTHFISHTAQNIFDRFEDVTSGKQFMLLALLNLGLYFLLVIAGQ